MDDMQFTQPPEGQLVVAHYLGGPLDGVVERSDDAPEEDENLCLVLYHFSNGYEQGVVINRFSDAFFDEIKKLGIEEFGRVYGPNRGHKYRVARRDETPELLSVSLTYVQPEESS